MNYKGAYLPAEGWLYFRVYCGYRTADTLLSSILYPGFLNMQKKGLAQMWFFVRFADPDFHLRFRIKATQEEHCPGLISLINRQLRDFISTGQVWNLEIGSYLPESGRYGSASMSDVEQLFFADSNAVAEMLGISAGFKDESIRWLFAMASIDAMLDDFNCQLKDKKDLLLGLNRSFGREFNKGREMARQLSRKYRSYRGRIMDLLSGDIAPEEEPFRLVLRQRSEQWQQYIENLNSLFSNDIIATGRDDLLGSLIHMSMNRIFSTSSRMQEMVIYDLLFRAYKESCHRKPGC